eukprot:5954037-Prymnesium_polylepis.1
MQTTRSARAARYCCCLLLLPHAAVGAPSSEPLYNLLTQRAVQSCCFTARSVRDNPTAQWLGNFLGHEGLELFHGVDGLKVPWRNYLTSLLEAPPEDLTIESVLKKHRGLSSNNPFLQPTPMTYTHRIVPSAIANRVLQSARFIAQEWEDDLRLTEAENAELWARHDAVVRTKDDAERATRLPVLDHDPDNNPDSPYRGGNYDLLKVLAVRTAANDVLQELERSAATAKAAVFLRRFMLATPLEDEAEGHHRADAFLSALLDEPFTINDGVLIDPLDLADQVMQRRLRLARDWAAALRDEFPAELLTLQREHLRRNSAAT